MAAAALSAAAPTAGAHTETRTCSSVNPWPSQSCWGYSGSYHSWITSETAVGVSGGINPTCATAFTQAGNQRSSATGFYCTANSNYRYTVLSSSTPTSRTRGYYQGSFPPHPVATKGVTP